MGIRFKLLLTFVLCFGLMAALNLAQLEHNMSASYDAIERREMIENSNRMLQGIQAELLALSLQSADWAAWNATYEFAQKPDPVWAEENIGVNAMKPVHFSMVLVVDAKAKLLLFETRSASGQSLNLPELSSGPYFALFSADANGGTPQCGLMQSQAGLMLVCRARISRNDGSGEFVGNLVAGRLLDQTLVSKLREQTQLKFELHEQRGMPQGLQIWPEPASAAVNIGSQSLMFAHGKDLYHFYYQLQDVLKQNVGILTLDVSRDLTKQGNLLYRNVAQLFVLTALGTALLLGFFIHHLLIRRLRVLTNELTTLEQQSTWHTRIKLSGSDELGQLSSGINKLLALIEQQVTSLKLLSLTDPLTALPNRREFDARLRQEFARQKRQRIPLALLTIDVDYFKFYNDHYGHPAGDLILKEIAEILASAVSRSSDLAARIGGEEFCLLLPDTDAAGAVLLAESIRSKLQARNLPHVASLLSDRVTLSIGGAIAGDESIEAFVSRTDHALYRAKHEGRDRVCFDAGATE
ncbi:diguanylate cyclase [Undibacterium parvum]|uniref:diguanylate cyclase n=1 Tax=Undibacterium parvum TaxID=401471 RepID=A0A3Q9BR03_9BURK|nr:diguanylate cyclase [Undibacterium parvum]AZP12546.1 diguanylate cyclase [Undibacterium parvum]